MNQLILLEDYGGLSGRFRSWQSPSGEIKAEYCVAIQETYTLVRQEHSVFRFTVTAQLKGTELSSRFPTETYLFLWRQAHPSELSLGQKLHLESLMYEVMSAKFLNGELLAATTGVRQLDVPVPTPEGLQDSLNRYNRRVLTQAKTLEEALPWHQVEAGLSYIESVQGLDLSIKPSRLKDLWQSNPPLHLLCLQLTENQNPIFGTSLSNPEIQFLTKLLVGTPLRLCFNLFNDLKSELVLPA